MVASHPQLIEEGPGADHNPEGTLAHAVALARRSRELEGGVGDVRVQAQALRQALHEEGVPARKGGHRQDADAQRAVKAPASEVMAFAIRVHCLGCTGAEGHACWHIAAD